MAQADKLAIAVKLVGSLEQQLSVPLMDDERADEAQELFSQKSDPDYMCALALQRQCSELCEAILKDALAAIEGRHDELEADAQRIAENLEEIEAKGGQMHRPSWVPEELPAMFHSADDLQIVLIPALAVILELLTIWKLSVVDLLGSDWSLLAVIMLVPIIPVVIFFILCRRRDRALAAHNGQSRRAAEAAMKRHEQQWASQRDAIRHEQETSARALQETAAAISQLSSRRETKVQDS